MVAEVGCLLITVFIDCHASLSCFFELIISIISVFLIEGARLGLVQFNWIFLAGATGLSIGNFMLPTIFINIFFLQGYSWLAALLFLFMLFEDIIDFVIY